jgi:hypoxanthine phosphoribosyltransferase
MRTPRDDVQEILIDEKTIARKVAELAKAISRDYSGKDLLIIGVLKGAFVFLSDLLRQMSISPGIDFVAIESYTQGTESSGVVRVLKDLDENAEGRHLLIVEDIVDTGLTLDYLVDNMRNRKAASVKVCALLHKPERLKVEVKIDYKGFTIPDKFVVGYGLDYAQRYRELPFVGVLKPEIYGGESVR